MSWIAQGVSTSGGVGRDGSLGRGARPHGLQEHCHVHVPQLDDDQEDREQKEVQKVVEQSVHEPVLPFVLQEDTPRPLPVSVSIRDDLRSSL